jgi:hypothetical protein
VIAHYQAIQVDARFFFNDQRRCLFELCEIFGGFAINVLAIKIRFPAEKREENSAAGQQLKHALLQCSQRRKEHLQLPKPARALVAKHEMDG